MHHTDIDALLLERGFAKDPELVKTRQAIRDEAEKSGRAAQERTAREQLAEAAKGAKGHFDKEKTDEL